VHTLADDWWEHHWKTQKRQSLRLVRDVRRIAKLGKLILWDGIVRAVVRRKRKTGSQWNVQLIYAAFFKYKTHRIESRAMWDIPVASIRISNSLREPSQEVACALKGTEVRPPLHCSDCTVSDTVNHCER
jgi:hypothetical protein